MSLLGSVGTISMASAPWATLTSCAGHKDFILWFGFVFSPPCPKAGGKHLSQREESAWGLRLETLRFPCQMRSEAEGPWQKQTSRKRAVTQENPSAETPPFLCYARDSLLFLNWEVPLWHVYVCVVSWRRGAATIPVSRLFLPTASLSLVLCRWLLRDLINYLSVTLTQITQCTCTGAGCT